VHDRDVMMLED